MYRMLTAFVFLAAVALPARAQAWPSPLDLSPEPDQARAVIAVLTARADGDTVPDSLWARLHAAEGYRRAMERERGMNELFGLDRGIAIRRSGPLPIRRSGPLQIRSGPLPICRSGPLRSSNGSGGSLLPMRASADWRAFSAPQSRSHMGWALTPTLWRTMVSVPQFPSLTGFA